MLTTWPDRPQELANLLNPAFIGMMLYRSIAGFQEESKTAMPLELAVLVPPLILHSATRGRLPRNTRTSLATWVQDNRDLLIEFAHRTSSLMPYTRESLFFLLSRDAIALSGIGFTATPKALTGVTPYQKKSDEIKQCYLKSHFAGRWLALAGNTSTIYALLGITP